MSFLSDGQSRTKFESWVSKDPRPEFGLDGFKAVCMSWDENGPQSLDAGLSRLDLVLSKKDYKVRILFVPLDLPNKQSAEGVRHLCQHFEVPGDFLEERMRSVVTSFGAHSPDENTLVSWSHFLSKTTHLTEDGFRLWDPQFKDGIEMQPQSIQQWHRLGAIVAWRKFQDSKERRADAIVFGSAQSIQERFQQLCETENIADCSMDPFGLWAILFDELWREIDDSTEKIRQVLGPSETTTLRGSSGDMKSHQPDFTDIYSLSKHIVYLKESIWSMQSALDGLIAEHESFRENCESVIGGPLFFNNVHRKLQHVSRLLEGTRVRLTSFDTRVQNFVQLCFNILVKQDSDTLLHESHSLRTITFITMFFLPAATVSSICGSSFYYQYEGSVHGASNQYLFWAVTGGLTVFVFVSYLFMSKIVRNREELRKAWLSKPSHIVYSPTTG